MFHLVKRLLWGCFAEGRFFHLCHCLAFGCFATFLSFIFFKYRYTMDSDIDPVATYSLTWTVVIFLIRFITNWIIFIFFIMEVFGLVFYNAFKGNVKVKVPLDSVPFICFRVATRGDYPQFVINNVEHNKDVCLKCGLTNFVIQVVSEQELPLPVNDRYIMQTVIPQTYATKSGAKFKGRVLQYAIEDYVNKFSDKDWIVHLDEDSRLTTNSVNGIINFVSSGNHDIGLGLVVFMDENLGNYFPTLIDNVRVAYDLGKLRFQLKAFHRLFTEGKGSFLVASLKAERDITFDYGVDSSVTEDIFFCLKASSRGYTFDFIEGEILEMSALTTMDCIKQRKRWVEGVVRVVRSPHVPSLSKICLSCSIFVVFPAFIINLSLFEFFVFPLKLGIFYEIAMVLSVIIICYMNLFGFFISLNVRKGCSKWSFVIYVLLLPFSTFINISMVAFIIPWGYFSAFKSEAAFDVTKKELQKTFAA